MPRVLVIEFLGGPWCGKKLVVPTPVREYEVMGCTPAYPAMTLTPAADPVAPHIDRGLYRARRADYDGYCIAVAMDHPDADRPVIFTWQGWQ